VLNATTASDQPPVRRSDRYETPERSGVPQYLTAAAVVLGVTLPAFLLQPLVGPRAIALIYLLAVVLMSLFIGPGPTFLAATLSALFWDFFFLAPITNLRIANAEDAIMFGMYFVVALVLGQLTARIRAQEQVEREREKRATALYLLTRDLAEAPSLDELLRKAVQQMEPTFQTQIALLLPPTPGRTGSQLHPASTYDIAGPEQPVVEWVFQNGQPAGKFTDHQPGLDTQFVPLKSGGQTLGVIGLHFGRSSPLTLQQQLLLDAFAQHISIALDRHRLQAEAEKARLLAESERLSKNLLNSMSHEIRTPLAAIQSATSNLLELNEPVLSGDQQAMIAEIQEATGRLNGLVGKVLDITRLESGGVKPKLSQCDVNDLVHVAVKETRKALTLHPLTIELAPNLPLVPADHGLLHQALTNLLSNAALHTPAGTAVQIGARARDWALLLTVADRGPGLPPDFIPRVFDKFSRGPAAPTGGTGLGLSLVKGFVEAQGGQVKAENREGGGAVFTIRLPLGQTSQVTSMQTCD